MLGNPGPGHAALDIVGKLKILAAVGCLGACLGATAWLSAGEATSGWGQWRGPLLAGLQPNARDIPVNWGPGENLQWKVELPSWSAATPIVAGNLVFVSTAAAGFHEPKIYRKPSANPSDSPQKKHAKPAPDSKKIYLLALDRATGKELWRRESGDQNRIYRKQNLSSPSPVTDGTWIWTLTGAGRLSAFDRWGKLRWRREIAEEFGPLGLAHGYASSPLLDGGRIFIQVIHAKKPEDRAYVFAVDKRTGKTLWKVDRPSHSGVRLADDYSTPTLAVVDGRKQLIVSGGDAVTGHDPATGRELWRRTGFNPHGEEHLRTIASTLAWQDRIYATVARGKPLIAFRISSSRGDEEELWRSDHGGDVPSPACDGKLVYVVNDRGIATALDALTGAKVWGPNRLEPGSYSASPLLADGKLIAVNESGTATVMRAGPRFEVLGVNRLGGHVLSSPVAVDDQLFLRTSEALYAIRAE